MYITSFCTVFRTWWPQRCFVGGPNPSYDSVSNRQIWMGHRVVLPKGQWRVDVNYPRERKCVFWIRKWMSILMVLVGEGGGEGCAWVISAIGKELRLRHRNLLSLPVTTHIRAPTETIRRFCRVVQIFTFDNFFINNRSLKVAILNTNKKSWFGRWRTTLESTLKFISVKKW